MICATRNARHLVDKMQLPQLIVTIKQFTDGELFVRIDENVHEKHVWVITSTEAPAEHMLELFFLLDALHNAGATCSLFISYFGYARQIITQQNECRSAQLISTILQSFHLQKIYILHVHNELLHDFLPFNDIYDMRFFCTKAEEYDCIAAPDKGAHRLAQEIAQSCGKELILLKKMRPEQEQVQITSVEGSVKHKKILLVDDIISTGRTLVSAAKTLLDAGANHVSAAATHGIFAPGSSAWLEQSVLKKIYVTNSVHQKSHPKIEVTDLHLLITSIIQ